MDLDDPSPLTPRSPASWGVLLVVRGVLQLCPVCQLAEGQRWGERLLSKLPGEYARVPPAGSADRLQVPPLNSKHLFRWLLLCLIML